MTGLGQSIYQKGVKYGKQQGSIETIIDLVKEGLLQIADAARKAGMSETEFSELLKEKSYELMEGGEVK